MSLNWYKIAQIKKVEKECLLEDSRIFAGVEITDSPEEISEPDEEVQDIDTQHQYRPINERIEEGKHREATIIDKINQSTPFILEPSGDRADIGGIDAYLVGYRGSSASLDSPLTVQIKHRLKGGDDLGLEVMKGWPPQRTDIRAIDYDGKDMKTPVDYYFHIDRSGMLRIFNGKMIREIAQKMSVSAIAAWGHHEFRGNRHHVDPYGEVLIVRERGIGGRRTRNNSKVITYIDINELSPTYEFKI